MYRSDVVRAFFQRSRYNLRTLTNGGIAEQTQEKIAAELSRSLPSACDLLDVCCGGAWLPIRLARSATDLSSATLVDYAPNQIVIARELTARYASRGECHFSFIVADARWLPLKESIYDAVTFASAVHLFSRTDLRIVAEQLRRVTRLTGSLVIITFDREDIGRSVFDRYIEGYAATDRERYFTVPDLDSLLVDAGWEGIRRCSVESELTYTTATELGRLAWSKSFSTFALLGENIGADALNKRIVAGLERMQTDLRQHPIVYRQRTVALFYRRVS